MNFFFGLNNSILDSTLTIPRFPNSKPSKKKYKVFQLEIRNNLWEIINLRDIELNKDFYKIDSSCTNNGNIFFLATEEQILKLEKINFSKLINLNNYTDTSPEYRANLQVSIPGGGFSSYQSDYPFQMVRIKGSILSPINSLCNKDADENFIFLRNIFELPIQDEFRAYFVNLKTKKILKKMVCLTNFSNEIVVEKEFIHPEVFLFTDKFVGIPIYCSIKNKHISLEHSSPPHDEIMAPDKFKVINQLKNEFYEIIN